MEMTAGLQVYRGRWLTAGLDFHAAAVRICQI